MNEFDVDRALRRASDDVLATVVRTAAPPPVASLDRARPFHPALAYVLVAAAIAGVFALGRIRQGDHELAPAADPPTVTAHTGETSPAASPSTAVVVSGVDLCADVATVASMLTEVPTEADVWEDIGRRVDRIDAALVHADLAEVDRRAVARFVVLAGRAADLGIDGGSYPARPVADDAVVVAAGIAERYESCTIDTAPTSSPSTSTRSTFTRSTSTPSTSAAVTSPDITTDNTEEDG